ncbi:gliding motility protein RemB [Leptobacterium flavescens]|uniref:Gliding motility protein RemB n=1 Tax=Leptobacterium flavescens TaxID=472055 RepID=A0A6P0UNV1_9FLAO|nr:gliding motility protein RemB [Leptobacterium flavescens]NER12663.1 gliding motility protein RemB [Leptobacterium flavescens]
MRKLFTLVFFSAVLSAQAQESSATYEKYPVFDECKDKAISELKDCFDTTLRAFLVDNFKIPSVVTEEAYTGEMSFLFEVNEEGAFRLMYVDAVYNELKDELGRVFSQLPVISPPTYSGEPTYMQFSMRLKIPLEANTEPLVQTTKKVDEFTKDASDEFKKIVEERQKYANDEYSSELNIPFSHQRYALFDAALNQVGSNNHTAVKPYVYSAVADYFDLEAYNKSLSKNKKSWFGRKWWDEHMVTVKGKDYWFTLDPVADLQLGKDNSDEVDYTYNNTRGVYVRGGLGKKFNFSASLFESQGRFANYFNDFARSIRPSGGNPAIIPGRGIAKEFNEDAFDYPVAEGYISYSPSKNFNVQFGHGRNFIGDGYRSLFLSDIASPYPFLKLNTSFWKIKYTNTWMSLRDVRPEATEDGAFLTKYVATHYLSWNVSKKLNLGFYEAVVWDTSNDRGLDVNYLNPLIFYRFIEFATGSRAGNAILGLSSKFKWNDRINLYGQFILDELSIDDFFGREQNFRNKYGIQLGIKYYNAFKVDGLLLQAEFNQVRPYTYSHNTIRLNFGHNNQPLAHPRGANFREVIGTANYNYKRWFGTARLIYGEQGLDIEGDTTSFGGNIFTSEDNRPSDNGIELLQGNKASTFFADMQIGYLINPATNLKVFGNFIYRNFDPSAETTATFKNSTTWFNIGLRTDLFNWYNDYQ